MTSHASLKKIVFVVMFTLIVLALWWASRLGTALPGTGDAPTRLDDPLVVEVQGVVGAQGQDGHRVAANGEDVSRVMPFAAPASPPTAALRVLVLDEGGQPVPGCSVTADGISATTDPRGRAEFLLDPGRKHVSVDPPADRQLKPRSGWQTLRAGSSIDVVLVLWQRQATVQWCRLVADEDGRPLAGVPVQVYPAGTLQHSGKDGLVQLVFGPEDTYAEAKALGRSLRHIAAEAGHEAAATAMRVPLVIGASLRVGFIDTTNSAVTPGSVTLTCLPWYMQWPPLALPTGPTPVWSGTVDAHGVVELTDLPVRVALRASFAGPATLAAPDSTIWVLAGRREERRVEWSPRSEVHGVVKDAAGDPVRNVGVRVVRTQSAVAPRGLGSRRDALGANTDAEGRFRVAGLGPGAWLVGLVAEAPFAPTCVRIELAPGGSANIELRVDRGLDITGRALAPDGRPAAGVTVNVHADDEYLAAATTDRDGRFHLKSLPSGPCKLLTGQFEGDLGLHEPRLVQAGDQNVELRLTTVSGSISGRCGAGDVWIMASRRGSDDAFGRSGELDGGFNYHGMRVGTWDVWARDRNGRAAVAFGVQVLPGRETTVQLDLAPGATLLLLHATANEFVVQRGDQVAARDNLQPGIRSEAVVTPGTWTVNFIASGREVARREITVTAGARVEVDAGR